MYTEIKTFEDACQKLGIEITALPAVPNLPEADQKAIIAHTKLVIICKALNLAHLGHEFKPDWNNRNQDKWYPWFDMDGSWRNNPGSGFAFHGCGYVNSGSGVGSRLCFASEELAKYAATQFIDLYKEYFVKS